jgi:hypothetical protein
MSVAMLWPYSAVACPQYSRTLTYRTHLCCGRVKPDDIGIDRLGRLGQPPPDAVTSRKIHLSTSSQFFHEDTPCLKGTCHASPFCFRLCPLQPSGEP